MADKDQSFGVWKTLFVQIKQTAVSVCDVDLALHLPDFICC